MKVQKKCLLRNNRVAILLILFLGLLSFNSSAATRMSDFTVELLERPLSILLFPVQHGMANSDFVFNLEPFISVIKPEINYQITNKSSQTLSNLELAAFPEGLTRSYKGENVCSERFTLYSNQSCFLRFYVDKNNYMPSKGNDPFVCSNSGNCSSPVPGQQFDDAVAKASGPTQVQVTPAVQNGLLYDPTNLSITGKPDRAGFYLFKVSATNDYATTATRDLQIYIGINPKDKPVFKTNYPIPAAAPNEDYHLNLMDLIELKDSFNVTNQVCFHIGRNHRSPEWLRIDENTSLLQGHVPSSDAGQQKEITLIASSNTGGDSLPLTITIPVAFDPAKKPIIATGIALRGEAGNEFHSNFQRHINDPTADNNVKIVIDKIEPPAPWLSVSSWRPTEIEGIVPEAAVGQIYQIILHANTTIGGDSDTVIIPLHITIDKSRTPRFYAANPHLPLFHVGQSYVYDFVANRDVYPEYNDIPYTIELAEGYKNPAWVRIEDNKLIVDRVPDNLNIERVFITIKNIPGGQSRAFSLKLLIMD